MSFSVANKDRSTGLQAMRGLAALFVLFQHVFWLAGYFSPGPTALINTLMLGGTGVFLFFALSGFLMITQIERPVKQFLSDRLRRIYPGFGLAVLVSGGALACFNYDGWPKLTTMLLLPTGEGDSIYIPYWTLVYEMQFYLIITFVGRFPKSLHVPIFAIWTVAILVSSFDVLDPVRAAYPSASVMIFSFYNLYFISGMIAWWSLARLPVHSWEGGLAFFTVIMLALECMFFRISEKVYYYSMLLVVFWVVRYLSTVNLKNRLWLALVHFGDVSYGFYLMHITSGFIVVLIVKNSLKLQLSYWEGAGVILVLGGGAAYIFGWLELKLQRFFKEVRRRRVRASTQSSPI